MPKRRKRRVRKSIKVVLLVLIALIATGLLYVILNFNLHFVGVKSIHGESAEKYNTKHCLAFYPSGSRNGQDVAKKLCEGVENDLIFDYTLKPYGDYYLVDYGQGSKYFVDHNYQEVSISGVSEQGKVIISDYLRYQYKKEGRDEAFTKDFIEKSYHENLNISDAKYDVEGENVLVHLDSFDITLQIPLKYMQNEIGMNFGYTNELYQKPRYIDPKRPMIALTFDDGPYIPTTSQIIDVLYRYDAVGTFFCLGSRLGEKEIAFVKGAVEKGNEYASHTQSHLNLRELSDSKIKEEITTPANDLFNGFGYSMRLYRPPFGERDSNVDNVSPYPAIMWNVDSLDWKSRDAASVKEIVFNEADADDIVLFHDLYQSTVDAIVDIVPALIDEGYQLVTVSELMHTLGIDSDIAYFSGK